MQFIQGIIFAITSFILPLLPLSTYTEGVVGQPRSFFPHKTVTETDETISSLIYRGLFKYDIYGELVPDLAESWEPSQDGIVYTVKLKEGQTWSDGTPVTADDIIYTSFKLPQLRDVATDKVDNRTVRFTLPNKYSPFLNLLTVPIMKSNSEENYDGLMPISNGDYKVIGIKRSGPVIKEVILYNNKDSAKFKKLVFTYYTNEEELLTGAKLGEIDGFTSSKEIDLKRYENYKFPLQGVYYALYFNLSNEKLQDVELRQKLEKVLDKEKLVFRYGIPVQGPISRSTYTDTSLDFDPFEEDLIDELVELESVDLTIPDLPQHKILAEQIKNIWKDRLGYDVNIVKVDPEKITDKVIKNRNFEILLYGQETSRDPDRYVNWHSTQKDFPGLNLSGFEQVRADRALEEGRNLLDKDERQVHYSEFQLVVSEQVPAIFLYHPYVNYYVSDYVQGVGEKYTFSLADRFLDFSSWRQVETF